MKPASHSKDLLKGAFILMAAALITKVLSAVYRIPFQNIAGDVGFYIYQQVYPFYGIAIVLATTGFPVVISKLYAELREKNDLAGARHFLFITYVYLQLFGLICFLILYVGSDKIARWMDDPKLVILLKVVSIVFITFPVVALLRGLFQGNGDMFPTAVSQVAEQAIRVATILILAYLFMHRGASLYLVGGGAMFGSVTGSLVSAVLLFMFLWLRKKGHVFSLKEAGQRGIFRGTGWILKALVFQGMAICISGMLMIFFQMADSLNLYSLLMARGIEAETAKALKGIFDRGQPLIQLGTVLSTSMSLSLVPIITSERMKANIHFLSEKIRLALQISLVIGVGATAGLWAVIKPTNIMLFENSSGSEVLGVLSMVILFTSVISTLTAVLQGLGKMVFPSVVILASFPVKYVLNAILVPLFGTQGAAWATIISMALITLLLGANLRKVLSIRLISSRFIAVLAAGSLIMILILKGYLAATEFLYDVIGTERLAAAIQALSAVMLGGFLFLFVVIRSSIFREEDLALFPFGSKLILLLPKGDRSQKYGKND